MCSGVRSCAHYKLAGLGAVLRAAATANFSFLGTSPVNKALLLLHLPSILPPMNRTSKVSVTNSVLLSQRKFLLLDTLSPKIIDKSVLFVIMSYFTTSTPSENTSVSTLLKCKQAFYDRIDAR